MGGSAGKSAAEAQAVLHSMLLPDLYHSPRSLTDLFYWYRKFTFINEPQTHISSKQEKRSHWEVTEWKGYGESEAGTGKEGKAALGAHHSTASGKAAESLGIKMRGQALNKVKVSRCWCGVVPDTKPSVQTNTQTHIIRAAETSFVPKCRRGGKLPVNAEHLNFLIGDRTLQANSAQSHRFIWCDPICLGSSKFLLPDKNLIFFLWKAAPRQVTLPHR